MQIPRSCVFNCQARFRRSGWRGQDLSRLACELAGLTGLLGWLAVLFYLTALGAARLA